MVIKTEKTFNKTREVIKDIILDNTKDFPVSDITLENLCIHLSLSITRELAGTYIHTSHSQLENCKKEEAYPIAKNIVRELSKHFDIQLTENDCFFTTMYLANKSLLDLDFDPHFDIIDDDMEIVMDEALDRINKQLGYNLKDNTDFYQGISLHFYPALERLQTHTQLEDNPLVKQSNEDFKNASQCAQILNEVVQEHYHDTFNEHELAYITLHFGTAFYHA